MKLTSSAQARISIIVSMLIWGSIGLFRRWIPLSSGAIAAVRALGGVIFLLIFMAIRRQRISFADIRKNLPVLCLSGAFMGFNWISLFEAYRYTSVAVATLCYYMAPMIVMLLSPLLLGERLTGKKIACLLSSLAGMTLVSGVFDSGGAGSLRGVLLGLAAAVLYASVILGNKKLKDISSMDRTIAQLGVAAVAVLPYALITGTDSTAALDGTAVGMLIIVAVVHTGVAYALYFGSMGRLPAQTTALMSYIDPIAAILLSAAVLKEAMSPLAMVGGALVLGAVILCELPEKKRR